MGATCIVQPSGKPSVFKFLFTPPDADPGAPPEADGVPLGPDDPEAGTDDAGDPVEVPKNNQIIIIYCYKSTR